MSNNNFIPLSVPNISGNEWKYVKDCLDTGWISSVGSYVNKFEETLATFTGAKYGVAVVNGTAALHISLILSGVRQNDYVIIPNITFVATANSVVYMGAEPILIDTDADNWQMDLDILEEFLENETFHENGEVFYRKDKRRISLIMPVHIQGNMFDMDRFTEICNRFHLPFLEDATEALGSTYKGVSAGRFSKLGTFSFNGNKIISTGGGGMIVTDDEELAKKAKHLTTQAKSDPFEYYHDEVGYNYRLVNVLAAIGVAQMEQLPLFLKRKKEIDAFYRKALEGVGDITFQKVDSSVDPNCWLFTIKTDRQKGLLKRLNDEGLQSRPFWVPMNKLPMFSSSVYVTKEDMSDKVYSRCLTIPCSTNISDAEMTRVAEVIQNFY